MRHAPKLLAAFSLPFLLLLNPLILQGCFLRCPEPLPYDDSEASRTTAERLDQLITVMHDDGVLELQLSKSRLLPNGSMRADSSTLHLIQPALAIPSCQTHEPGPSSYTVSTSLVATWIPAEGEPITLLDDVPLNTNHSIDPSQARKGRGRLQLSASGVQLYFEGDERYQLDHGTVSVELDGRSWTIAFTGDTITTLQYD